jgi:hypothetical protein
MRTSESIDQLAAAMSAAQGAIEDAVADSQNPHFRSSYADLSSVRAAIRKPLAANGLSIVQFPTMIDGRHALTTRLMHKSGQWIEADAILNIDKPTMQGLGSAITYMRRYALAAVTGIAQADDDGNEATRYPAQRTPSPQAPMPQAPAPQPSSQSRADPGKPVTENQLKRMHAIANSKGWSTEQVKRLMASRFNVMVSRELTMNQYDQLIDALEAGPQFDQEYPPIAP